MEWRQQAKDCEMGAWQESLHNDVLAKLCTHEHTWSLHTCTCYPQCCPHLTRSPTLLPSPTTTMCFHFGAESTLSHPSPSPTALVSPVLLCLLPALPRPPPSLALLISNPALLIFPSALLIFPPALLRPTVAAAKRPRSRCYPKYRGSNRRSGAALLNAPEAAAN